MPPQNIMGLIRDIYNNVIYNKVNFAEVGQYQGIYLSRTLLFQKNCYLID